MAEDITEEKSTANEFDAESQKAAIKKVPPFPTPSVTPSLPSHTLFTLLRASSTRPLRHACHGRSQSKTPFEHYKHDDYKLKNKERTNDQMQASFDKLSALEKQKNMLLYQKVPCRTRCSLHPHCTLATSLTHPAFVAPPRHTERLRARPAPRPSSHFALMASLHALCR